MRKLKPEKDTKEKLEKDISRFEKMHSEVLKAISLKKEFADKNNGKKISLGNTLVAFGIPIETSVKWREQLLEPKEFLGRDERLIEELKILKQHFNLICVTNNPVLPARKTLEAIGVETLIPEIVGLDTCFKSKPAVEPFMTAVERIGCKVEECLAIGDRYDMDIGLPLEMGMGGILVTGVEELYDLHKLLLDE